MIFKLKCKKITASLEEQAVARGFIPGAMFLPINSDGKNLEELHQVSTRVEQIYHIRGEGKKLLISVEKVEYAGEWIMVNGRWAEVIK